MRAYHALRAIVRTVREWCRMPDVPSAHDNGLGEVLALHDPVKACERMKIAQGYEVKRTRLLHTVAE